MIVTCPSCSARFRVADEQIGTAGRAVRCGRCSYVWHQMPIPAEATPLPLEEPAPEPRPGQRGPGSHGAAARHARPAEPPAQRPKPVFEDEDEEKSGSGLVIGWLVVLLVLAGAAAAAWYWRAEIVARVPAATQVYEWLGVDLPRPPPEGRLEVANFTFIRSVDGTAITVVVNGEVANGTSTPQTLPPLRARALDPGGAEVAAWQFDPPVASLPPGGRAGFETRHGLPEGTGEVTVEVGFAPQP